MEMFSPVGPYHRMLPERAAANLYLNVSMKAGSGSAINSPDDGEDEDIDGCEVQVVVPTSDEELPAAEGGVA